MILGEIGPNFGAGMTGGMAYLYDPNGETDVLMNMETLVTGAVRDPHWLGQLERLLEAHLEETGSLRAADILQHWDETRAHFVQVCPLEMVDKLPAPLGFDAVKVPAE